MHFPRVRLQRLRQSKSLRALVQEVHIKPEKLIAPIFVTHGTNVKNPISSMPTYDQWSVDRLHEVIERMTKAGVKHVLLFGIPPEKDASGTHSCSDDGIIQQAIREIKRLAPTLTVFADICLCEYTNHGHCGVIRNADSNAVLIDNDPSIEILAKQALSYVRAGADVVAPSANMDGMVSAIRMALDENQFEMVPILSYSVKYASAMYGPFREAAKGSPQFGDRRTYQKNPANRTEAWREAELDVQEGADMLMVKPAHTYLDVIRDIKNHFPEFPLGAYHTSAEFAMIKAAAEKGWIDERRVVEEVLTSIHRAGADFIITYYAEQICNWNWREV